MKINSYIPCASGSADPTAGLKAPPVIPPAAHAADDTVKPKDGANSKFCALAYYLCRVSFVVCSNMIYR